APQRGTLLVPSHRVAVHAEEVQRQVTQELVATPVVAGVDLADALVLRRRLVLEVAPNHGGELVERLEDREVELGEEAEGKHHAAVPIDDERFHALTPPTRAQVHSPCQISTAMLRCSARASRDRMF